MNYFLVVFEVRIKGLLSPGETTNTMLVQAETFEAAQTKIKKWYKKELPNLEPNNFTNKTI